MTADSLYRKFVSDAGLFGKAFFGHRASRAEKRKMQYLWKKAQKESEENRD